MSMSRGRNAEKEKNRGLAPITRASDKLRCFFGKVQWKRKTAAVLIAAMMTGTMADSLNAVGLGRYANAYASSSDAVRAEEDDSGGRQSYSGSAESYYLEDAQEDLDLQLNGEELKDAMESEEPLELNYLYLPYEEEAAKVAAYDEIKKQAGKDYRLLDQGFLQADDDKVSYFVYGKKGKKSSNWIDDLKVFVLNGYDDQEKDGDYNVYFTIDSDELEITQGKVGVKVFKKSTAPTETAGGNVVTVGEPEETTTAQPTEEGTEPTEEIKIVTDQEESSPEQSEDIEESGTDETEKPEETSSEEAEEPESSVPEETKKAEETSSEEIEEPESPAPEETEKLEETSSEEIEELESSAPKETEKLEKADEPKEKTEAQEPVEREEKSEPEGTVDLSEAENSFSVSRHAVQMVMATPSDAKEENLYGDADAQIAAIREETTVTLRLTSKGKGYTFSEKELQLINMEEEDEEEEEDENPGIARFLARISRMAVKEQESHNILASPKYSVTRLDAKMRTGEEKPKQTVAQSVADFAETQYGETGDAMTLQLQLKKMSKGDTVYPGESEQFLVDLLPHNSLEYPYNGDVRSLFDAYEDVKIHITLPDNLELYSNNSGIEGVEWSGSKSPYTLNLGTVTPGSNPSYNFWVKVKGNGSTPIGTPITISKENIVVEATIHIKDKSNGEPGETVKIFNLHKNADNDIELRTGSEDDWGVTKTVVNPENVDAPNGSSFIKWEGEDAVVTYIVEVGLKNGGKVISDSGRYDDPGRVPLSSFQLNDTFSVKGKNNLSPQSIKIWKYSDPLVKNVADIIKQDPIAIGSENGFTLGIDDLNTCAGKSELSGVDGTAPYYTAYLVQARYPADEFAVDEADYEAEVFPYEIRNDVEISYQRQLYSGTEEVKTRTAYAEVQPKKTLATIKIWKKIYDPITGKTLPYTNDGVYKKYAEFEIENVNSRKKYMGAVNPTKTDGENYPATGNQGYVEVKLPPGTYTIRESQAPDGTEFRQINLEQITLAEGETKEVTCTNQSTLGTVKFKKVVKDVGDTVGKGVGGIRFVLYEDAACEKKVKEVSSNKRGEVVFEHLDAGKTYYVKEIANSNYISDDRVYQVTVKKGEVTEELTNKDDPSDQIDNENPWVNQKNNARIQVKKRLVNYREENGTVIREEIEIPVADRDDITFSIQKEVVQRINEEEVVSWQTVKGKENLKLDKDSNFTSDLNVRDDNGKPIVYQIVEHLPEGKSYSAEEETGIAVTDSEVTVEVGTLEPCETRTIQLNNTKATGTISLHKAETKYSSNGYESNLMAAKFELYQESEGEYKKIKQPEEIWTDGGDYEIKDLKIVGEDKEGKLHLIKYYLKEVPPDNSPDNPPYDYKIECGDSTFDVGDYIGPFTVDASAKTVVRVNNIEKKVPFWIYKQDEVEKKGVGGAKFKVEDLKGNPVESKENDKLWSSGDDGYVYVDGLDPNTSYKITEVSAPKNYMGLGDENFQNIKTGDVPSNDELMHLNRENAGYKVIFQNKPIPETKIEKKFVDSIGKRKDDFPAEFEVYTRDQNGDFKPETKDGQNLIITANEYTRDLLPGVAYYFKEVIKKIDGKTPIDPSKLPDSWYPDKEIGPDDAWYFGPYTVVNRRADDKITLFSLNNYQYGSIKVEKRDALTGDRVTSGSAKFNIVSTEPYIKEGDEEKIYSRNVDTSDGYALFEDLPVFDLDGNRLTYQISEITPPEGYYISDTTPLVTQVIPGRTITRAVLNGEFQEPKEGEGKNQSLVIKDEPYFSLTAKKVWKDEKIGSSEKPLAGAKVALFELVGGDQLKFCKTGVTGDDGKVTFNQLDRKKTYYVIEVEPPVGARLPQNKEKLPEAYAKEGGTISKSTAESQYNFVVYKGSGTTTNETINDSLVNYKDGAQLEITKKSNRDDRVVIKGAEFALYQVIVPVKDRTLQLDPNELNDSTKYQLIDTYESDTGGKFNTMLLEYGELYLLVEIKPANGYAEIPGEKYTLYYPEEDGDPYTLQYLMDGISNRGRSIPYRKNKVTEDTIKNAPIDQYPATIYKYGYTPTDWDLNFTDAQLHEADIENSLTDSKILGGVKFKLERFNGRTWTPYPDPTTEYTTDNEGKREIPGGLQLGTYRLYEIPSDSTEYEAKYVNERYNERYLTFTVGVDDRKKDIYVYNPRKPQLEISKTGMDGSTGIAGVEFTVTNKNNKKKSIDSTDMSGKVTFSLDSGTYEITESKGNTQVTNCYFEPDEVDLDYNYIPSADGNYCILEKRNSSDDSDGVVKKHYKDPANFTLTIHKKDSDTGQPLSGAKFTVWYQKFEKNADGSYVQNTQPSFSGVGVETEETGADGKVVIPSMAPGWYKIKETTTPSGYSSDDTERIIAVNTDLTDIKLEPELNIPYCNLEKGDKGYAHEVTIENKPYIPITVNKEFSTGNTGIVVNSDEKEKALKQITFSVFVENGDSYEPVEVYQKDGNEFKNTKSNQLSLVQNGSSYSYTGYVDQTASNEFYVKEDSKGAGWYLLDGSEPGYNILATSSDADGKKATTTITNTLGKAVVIIKKVDIENPKMGLPGAEFAVYKDYPISEESTPIGNVDMLHQGNGTYKLTIPVDQMPSTYYIKETKAPATYELSEDVITVENLKAGELREYSKTRTGEYSKDWLKDLIIADQQGIDIKIVKYSNIKDKISDVNGQRMKASFNLYYSSKIAGEEESWNHWELQTTDEQGELTFANLPIVEGRRYAIEEVPFRDGDAYEDYELDSVYNGETLCKKETVTIDGTGHQVYILDVNTEKSHTLTFQAYNMPAAKLTIHKKDADDPNAQPTATFYIYPDGVATNSDAEPYKQVVTVEDPSGGSKAEVNLKPGKYYIVEHESDPNYRIIKDNKKVIWEQYVEVKKGDTEVQLEPFANVRAGVKPTLEKKTETAGLLENMLMTDKQEVKYSLTPGVARTEGVQSLPLKHFMVMDSGLTMWHQEEKVPLPNDFVNERYTVQSVTLKGPITYDNDITGAEEIGSKVNVKAIVKFYRFDKDISRENQNNWSEIKADAEATVPAEALQKNEPYTVYVPEGKKYKGFSVTYVDENLQEQTAYAVGSNFNPGTIEATMVLDRQPATEKRLVGPEVEEKEVAARSVDKIVNEATTLISYLDWNSKGESKLHTHSDKAPNYAEASSEIRTKEPAAPRVAIKKVVTPQGDVSAKKTLTYYIKLENLMKDKEDASMVDPIIVDKLPQGLELTEYQIIEKDDEISAFNAASGGESLEKTNQDGFNTEKVELQKLGENADYLMFRLDGKSEEKKKKSLSPGSTVILKITATVKSSVIAYDKTIDNYAYATTYGSNASFLGNEYASTFKGSNGAWAGFVSQDLEDAMKSYFTSKSLPAHGFISDDTRNMIVSNSDVDLLKLVAGDKEPKNFVDESQIARVTNGGYALYQLIVKNNPSKQGNGKNMVNLRIADVMPYDGDQTLDTNSRKRYSEFNLYFAGLTDMPYIIGNDDNKKQLLNSSQFDIWVTSSEYGTARNQLQSILQQFGASDHHDSNELLSYGWEKLSDENKIIKDNSPQPLYTAFLLEITDSNVILKPGDRLFVPIRGNVPQFQEGEELSQKVFKLAVNTFSIDYYNVSGEGKQARPMRTSNLVKVILDPMTVEVGGRIWIDADNDGRQTEEEYEYYSVPYIQTMLKKQTINLMTYTGAGTEPNDSEAVPRQFDYQVDGAKVRGYIDGKGRWTGRFYFDGLTSAAIHDSNSLYEETGKTPAYRLNTEGLIRPRYIQTYKIQISIPGGFELAKQNFGIDDSGKSREPKDLYASASNAIRNEAFDSNYGRKGNVFESEHFFLWQTFGSFENHAFDYTKDLGLVPYRDVTIKKSDEKGKPIDIKPINDEDGAGADIKIYGPFKPGEIRAAMLSEGNLAGRHKPGSGSGDTVEMGTAADGKAVLKAKLLRYMQYVIVEEKPASGYTVEGATANGLKEIEIGDNKKAWILPSMYEEDVKENVNNDPVSVPDNITITNKHVKGSLKFDKVSSRNGEEPGKINLKNAEFTLTAKQLEEDATFEASAKEFVDFINSATEKWEGAAGIECLEDPTFDKTKQELTLKFKAVSGHVDFNVEGTGMILPKGEYTLTETKPPIGYDDPQNPVVKMFTINPDNDSSTNPEGGVREAAFVIDGDPIKNVPQMFRIEKVAEENGTSISGVTFNLASKSTKDAEWSPVWEEKSTNQNGQIDFITDDLNLDPETLERTVYCLTEVKQNNYEVIQPYYFKLGTENGSPKLRIIPTNEDGKELDSDEREDVKIEDGQEAKGGIQVIKVTNTLETGSLTLRKELTGNDADQNRDENVVEEFEFTIRLTKPAECTNPVVAEKHVADKGVLKAINAMRTVFNENGISTEKPEEYSIKKISDVSGDGIYEISGITLKADESIRIDGIYDGTSYTVEEIPTVSTGYEFASTSDATRGVVASSEVSGTIRKNQDNSVTIRNTIKKASITLAKTFDSDIPDENDLPTFDIYDITDPDAEKGYTLYGSAAAIPDDAVSVGTIRIHEDTSIEGQSGHYIGESEKVLLPGHYYQIVEKLAEDDISKGYTAKVSGEVHVTVGENNRLVVAPEGIDIENNRTKGWLMVSKKLLDHDNDEIQESRTFYYKLYRRSEDDGEWREVNDASGKSIRSIQSHGEPDKLFVDFGTYRIRETDEGGNPYGDSVENLEYMVSNPDDIRVELREEGNREEENYTFEAPITNTERPLGKLTITKQADYAESGSRFYFTVKDGKGRYVQPEHDASGNVVLSAENAPITEEFLWEITAAGDVTYEQNGGRFGRLGTVSLDRMPYGTYTVTEVNADGTELDGETYIYTPLYQISVGTGMGETGNAVTGSGTGTIHIDQKEMTVTVTNRRSRGYLEIQKILQDAYGNSFQDMSRSFYYTVLDADGAAVELPEEYRYNGNSRIGRITTAGTHRLYLPFGTYRVLETDETGRIYDGQNQNERYDVTNPEAVTIALENADTAQAVIINKEKALGSLTVTKRTDWTPSGNTFYFQVVNEQGTRIPMPDEAGNPTAEMIWRIEAQNSAYEMTNVGSLTMRNLPYGSYTVTEVTEAGEELSNSFRYVVSYEASYQGVVRTSQSGTVDIISPAMTVTVTNTRRTANGGGTGGGGGTGSRSSRTTGPATEFIPDADVPLGMTEGGDGLDTTEILDEDVPLFGLPKTGDTSASAAGLLGLMLMSLLGAVGITRKRRKEEE